ncbi:hypothetical protein [Spongiimicrobium salis]|uniref:hypothetical protein n=1 Tax=Spongiimicrobium salis TaxID=1667022 RepID=UPI00374D41E8
MEDELLQELDSILKPAIERAFTSAKRQKHTSSFDEAVLENIKVEIDNTKVALSDTFYKLNLAQKSYKTSVERASCDFVDSYLGQNELHSPQVNANDYIKELQNGYEVWDGMRWVFVSKQANIKVDIIEDWESKGQSAVRIWAYDEKTKTQVLFVDRDTTAPGWDLSITHTGDHLEELLPPKNSYWESPAYNMAKNAIGVGGITAGALEIRQVGNMTPWRTGSSFKNASGWYRNKEGIYEQLSKQKGRGAGGYQKSAQRALKKSGKWNRLGKKFFYVGAAISIYDAREAIVNNDANRGEVVTKAAVDIFIGAVGVWGGPVGWAIAGTYFILDVSGAFGDWGEQQGISQSEYDRIKREEIINQYRDQLPAIEFQMEYVPTIEHEFKEFYLEERSIKRDNTRVVLPKVIFETSFR